MKRSIISIFLLAILLGSCASLTKYESSGFSWRQPMPDDRMEVADVTPTKGIVSPTQHALDNGDIYVMNSTDTYRNRRNGIGVIKDNNRYHYPNQADYYKYQQIGKEAIVELASPDSAHLLFRAYPSKINIIRKDYGRMEPIDGQAPPFLAIAPTKHNGQIWEFEGEMKIEPHLEAVPQNKDLYLKYKIKFHPTNRYKRKMKYGFKVKPHLILP